MTGAENERLAVLESKVHDVGLDVGEVKADVKAVLLALAKYPDLLAEHRVMYTEFLSNKGKEASRSQAGVWLRAVAPMALAAVSAVIALYGILTR